MAERKIKIEPETRKCANCRKIVKVDGDVGKRVFCSIECSLKEQRKPYVLKRPYVRKKRPTPPVLAYPCTTCGTDVFLTEAVYAWRVNKSKSGKIFCSRKCVPHAPKYRVARIDLICCNCRKGFPTTYANYVHRLLKRGIDPAEGKQDSLFCSRSCSAQWSMAHGLIKRRKLKATGDALADEWNQKLSDLGLGESAGTSPQLVYGREELSYFPKKKND